MPSLAIIEILVGMLPVLIFLGALLYLDSYKLVKLSSVVGSVAAGALVACASYFLNGAILSQSDIDWDRFSRYLAPLIEESLKGLVIIGLFRLGRIGFLVDAAIFGFAVGAGFSILENVYYFVFHMAQDDGLGTWIIRGFGTATMHGGATAIFAVTSLNFLDHPTRRGALALVPGFLLAYVVHSAYNHAFLAPIYETVSVMTALPLLLLVVFRQSEKAVGNWLGTGFDADTQMLELINSGELSDAPVGKYLSTLRHKFHGPVVADILCYVRLHTELALRAKGVLMMRAGGFEVAIDDETRDKFTELRYLERSIGKTGRMAVRPILRMTRKDLWQLYMLK